LILSEDPEVVKDHSLFRVFSMLCLHYRTLGGLVAPFVYFVSDTYFDSLCAQTAHCQSILSYFPSLLNQICSLSLWFDTLVEGCWLKTASL